MNYYLLTFSRTFHYLLIENNFKSLYRRIIAIKKSLFIPKNVYSFCLIIWFGNFSANSFYGYDLISSVWISFSKKEQCRKIRDIVTVLKSEGGSPGPLSDYIPNYLKLVSIKLYLSIKCLVCTLRAVVLRGARGAAASP